MGDVKYQTEEGGEGYPLTVADKRISNYTHAQTLFKFVVTQPFQSLILPKELEDRTNPSPCPIFHTGDIN